MSQIGISYTASDATVYNIVLENFGENAFPRTYQESASFEKSANGTSLISGPVYRQKYMWAISSIVLTTVATEFDSLFQDWDQDRSDGLSATCGVSDSTFGPTVSTSVVFSTPPSYTYMGPALTMISFGLMEV